MTLPAGSTESQSLILRSDPALWKRIADHAFDDPDAELPFSKRLAQENGWPQAYALRVIEEYRRFIYLMCIGDEELTPSDEVDQVWHLHLAYSRDYWDEFCAKVLNRPLHHGPTAGGPRERSRYEAHYGRTLALYQHVFGALPPPDIWPPSKIRFNPKARFVRVNRAYFTVLPKPYSRTLKFKTFLIFAALDCIWFYISFRVHGCVNCFYSRSYHSGFRTLPSASFQRSPVTADRSSATAWLCRQLCGFCWPGGRHPCL
jgi:hypothetical protein